MTAANTQAAWRGACWGEKIMGPGTLLTLHPEQKISCTHIVSASNDGLLNGLTKTTCSNGVGIEITYANGLQNGDGWFTQPDGKKLELEYDNGKLIRRGDQIFGISTTASKTKNQGTFKNDQRNRQSVQTLPDGEKREGEFKDGEIIKGIAFYPYHPVTGKTKYEGEFQKGKPHGKGKFTYEFGSYYEGDFENGKFNGLGRLIYKDGDHKIGMFKDGQFVSGTGTVKDTLEARKEAEKERALQQHLKNRDAWNSSQILLPPF
jgi:hypothetical protein